MIIMRPDQKVGISKNKDCHLGVLPGVGPEGDWVTPTKECGCLCSQSLPHRKPNCSLGPGDSRLAAADRGVDHCSIPAHACCYRLLQERLPVLLHVVPKPGGVFAQFGIANITSVAWFAVGLCLWAVRPCLLHPSRHLGSISFLLRSCQEPSTWISLNASRWKRAGVWRQFEDFFLQALWVCSHWV